MPELPEVETVRRGLEGVLVGRTISSVRLLRADLRRAMPKDANALLAGQRIIAIRRRAKYLRIETTGPHVLSHLGMTGSWNTSDQPVPLREHDHVVLTFSDGGVATYNDPRRFGMFEWWTEEAVAELGPEPLGADFNSRVLKQALRGKKAKVKSLLMDQRVVVGVGNIYASEALFRAGVSPLRASGRVTSQECERLVDSVRVVLAEAIAVGGSTISDYRQVGGEHGGFQHRFLVYDKAGAPCPRCQQPIVMRVVAGRSSFFCRRCQR